MKINEKNIEQLEKLNSELLNIGRMIESCISLLKITRDSGQREHLMQVISRLKEVLAMRHSGLKKISLIEEIKPGRKESKIAAENMWSLDSYMEWADSSRLKLHPVKKALLNGRLVYLDENNNEIKGDINRERRAISNYLKSLKSDYYAFLKKCAKATTMREMAPECRVAVIVPSYNEGKNILRFLESYSTQKKDLVSLLDNGLYEINIILNRPKREPEDSEGIRSIKQFMSLNPAIQVNWISIEMEERYEMGVRGVGLARKIMTDLTLLRSLSRISQAGRLFIQSEDCDHHNVDPRTISSVIRTFESKPWLDAVYGVQDRDPGIMKRNALLFMERRMWYFIERILQMEKIRIGNRVVERRLPGAPHWNFNWHRVVTGGWNTAFTAEAYSLIGGYNGHMTKGEDMDIGQRISIMRGRRENGKIIPCVDTIGRIYTRISSSPRRFLYSLARKEAAYESFEDPETDRRLKNASDEELLEMLKEFAEISYSNLNRFQGVLSGMFGFLLSVEGYDAGSSIRDDKFMVAEHIFKKAMFFLGFKEGDYEIKWVDYTDNRTGELRQGWGIEIISTDNFKNALKSYRKLEKNRKHRAKETRSILAKVKSMEAESQLTTLFWKRNKYAKKLREIGESLDSIAGPKNINEELSRRLDIIRDRSDVVSQTNENIDTLKRYLHELLSYIDSSDNRLKSIRIGDITRTIKSYLKHLEYERQSAGVR